MSNIFKKADIKAGYLLRVKEIETGDEFNMTVVPTRAYEAHPLAVLLFGGKSREEGDLATCCPGEHWWPLAEFDDDLVANDEYKVVAVYGCTDSKFLLDNSTEERELLWERETDEAPDEEVKPEPVKMTLAEIAEKLGHPVEIVEG
jgi:hypothetical protein